jgi:MOSC domain-containing protein YiiM
MSGEVVAIFASPSPGGTMRSLSEAQLEAGRGLVGDRYYLRAGTFSKKLEGKPDVELTLIESEEIERFNASYDLALGLGEPRRNVVTRGVRLNELVGRRFRIGAVTAEGIRLCEPCAHLAATVTSAVLPGLVHRAGLRASVIASGTIRPGDAVTLEP